MCLLDSQFIILQDEKVNLIEEEFKFKVESNFSEITFKISEELMSLLRTENLIIDRNWLSFDQDIIIGGGNFGCIYRGVLKSCDNDDGLEMTRLVAIKTLKQRWFTT